MGRGAWRATSPQGCRESDTTLTLNNNHVLYAGLWLTGASWASSLFLCTLLSSQPPALSIFWTPEGWPLSMTSWFLASSLVQPMRGRRRGWEGGRREGSRIYSAPHWEHVHSGWGSLPQPGSLRPLQVLLPFLASSVPSPPLSRQQVHPLQSPLRGVSPLSCLDPVYELNSVAVLCYLQPWTLRTVPWVRYASHHKGTNTVQFCLNEVLSMVRVTDRQ